MKMNTLKMKKMALIGLLGGLLFGVGDILVYLLPNCRNQNGIYEDWINMSDLRPAFTLYLGCIGAGLLLIGFYSWYQAIKENASIRLKGLMMVLVFGIMLTPMGHFLIACITPMIYKGAIQAGASSEMAMEIATYLAYYTEPVKAAVILIVIMVQSVTMVGMIVKKKILCPRWMVLLNPLGLTIISIPLSIMLSGTGLEGIMESFESLGEGLLYLPIYYHWKKQLL